MVIMALTNQDKDESSIPHNIFSTVTRNRYGPCSLAHTSTTDPIFLQSHQLFNDIGTGCPLSSSTPTSAQDLIDNLCCSVKHRCQEPGCGEVVMVTPFVIGSPLTPPLLGNTNVLHWGSSSLSCRCHLPGSPICPSW